MAIETQNVVLTLVGIGISCISIFFSFSALILIGERVNRVLQGNDINTPKTTIIRVSTMLGIGLGSVGIVLLFELIMQNIQALYVVPSLTTNIIDLINLLVSLIPYPFGGNYLLVEIFMQTNVVSVPASFWVTSLLGVVFFILITRSLYLKAIRTLHNVIYFEPKKFSTTSPIEVKPVAVQTLTPIRAYMKKDLSMATRDYQMLMFLIMPILLAVIGDVVSFSSAQGATAADVSPLVLTFALSTIYQGMSGLMLVFGFLTTENSGSSVIASLPIVVRDQHLAKLRLC